jgi:hypothetical protein
VANEDYVVTYQIQSEGHGRWSLQLCEFFRGPKEECARIAGAFAGAADDTGGPSTPSTFLASKSYVLPIEELL